MTSLPHPNTPQDNVSILGMPEPILLVDHPSLTGEGPLWHTDEQRLYWADIPTGEIFRYDPAAGTNERVYKHHSMVGGFTFQEDGSLLLFCDRGEIVHLWDGKTTVVVPEVEGERDGRFNDVIADPLGRVLCGTMPTEAHLGRLYLLHLDGTLELLFDDIGLSNGFGFSPDNQVAYHTDSNGHRIFQLKLDLETGVYSNRSILISTPEDAGVPDGMATDAEGTLWSARWDGYALYKVSDLGEIAGKVVFPVRKVSSVAFGGADFGTAYVTTAGGGDRGAIEGDLAGSLFSIDLGVKGRPVFRSRIAVS